VIDMSLWRHVSRGVRSLLSGSAADRAVDEEIQQFLDDAAADLEREGVAPEEAKRLARVRAGNPLATREQVRASGWEHFIETGIADLRYGLRRLGRNPGFAAVTIATLALGIGSATAIVSVAAPVFVRTLPFPDAERIVSIWDQTQNKARAEMTFGSFVELQERNVTFEAIAVFQVWQPTLSGRSTPERLEGMRVSADYFRVLGVSPRIGRSFAAVEDVPNGPPAVVLSDRIWRRRFDSDPTIVGRQVTLDGNAYDVIGVMPAGIEHRLMPVADVWRANKYDRTLANRQGREWGHHLRMIGRVRAGVSPADAMAELGQIARDPIARFARPPWATMPQGLLVNPLHDELTRDARPAMLAVVVAAALLLVIACVNVINLLLARNAERRAELAMRSALGAGRWRMIRQLVTETLVLAGLGGLGGLLIGQASLRGLALFGPAGWTHADGAALDAPVFAIAFDVTAAVGLVVGFAPAFSNRDLKGAVPQGSWQASAHHRMRRSLVVAEIAVALVLLVGAGLLFRSLQHLFAIAPGFDDRNVLSMQVQVAGRRFDDPEVTHRYFQQVLEAVRQVPGVTTAAVTTLLPLTGDSDVYGLQFESSAAEGIGEDTSGFRYGVSPGYFEAMRIPLRRGRLLSDQDRAEAPLAVVISEAFAAQRFPKSDPIGERVHIGPTDRPWFTIVGVVGDVRQMSLESNLFNGIYVTPEQWHFADRVRWFVVKAQGDAAALAPAIQSAIWSVDKDQAIVRVAPMSRWVEATAGTRRFAMILFEAFGFAALLLTAIGIYGVVSGGVNERTREIGVRTALGASRNSILAMVMRQGLWLSAAGVATGAVAAAMASRGLTTMLFGISPLDPASYVAVAVLLISVAMAASWLPAWRASRVDPAVTLRSE
jgi:putative ABC transport system permease protein